MINRIWNWIVNPRHIALIGGVILFVILAPQLPSPYNWVALVGVICIALAWAGVWWWQRKQAAKSGEQLIDAMVNDSTDAMRNKTAKEKEETQKLRARMNEAIKVIRKSNLGDKSGRAALYELPWYMIIGNPAAGKSSAIINSGLRFPFADKNGGVALQGVGGTRNCDWFFSTDGVLLDTAGRYSVYDEDHDEWLSFLHLLKKNRPRAPVNGIIIGVSVAELTSNNPDHAINLAKNLRSRVQDLTEQLEVFAPVYVVFTKMDLLAGFSEFFADYDAAEREQVWGATLPYQNNEHSAENAVTQFDQQFDVLYDGLKDLSTTRLSLRHQQTLSPSLMTFPMEFQAIRPVLRTLIATLFEDNPFQFKPIFRGFYFTSALQEGSLTSPLTEKMISRFGLTRNSAVTDLPRPTSGQGFFLKNLFSKVILSDKYLVKQYANRKRRQLRYVSFLATVMGVGLLLGMWTLSYMNNLKLSERVKADLAEVQRIQTTNQGDLSSQLKSLAILQDRLEQLDAYKANKPWSLRFGLYQGDTIEAKVRQEYLQGVKQVMLEPVKMNIEKFLGDANANAAALQPMIQQQATPQLKAAQQYTEASPTNVEDVYNGLKAYLMLGDHEHMDTSHLNDQITRFWRNWLEANRGQMSRSDLIRNAEKLISYSLAQSSAVDFPLVETNLALIDQTRDNLRRVVKGLPARERVYSEIKMRTSARYPSVTVAQIVGENNRNIMSGSHVVAGTFTRAAWDGYVSKAFDEAATKNTQASDWVLKSVHNDDLTLTGSPEQIRKEFIAMYKRDYAMEWQAFMKGVSYTPPKDFKDEVAMINQLGDPSMSPVLKLFEVFSRETSWDNPNAVDAGIAAGKATFFKWFKETILRRTPQQVSINVNPNALPGMPGAGAPQMGELGKAFLPVYNIMLTREDKQKKSFMSMYLENLGKVRSRFNTIKNAGDIGPGAAALVKQTLGEGSELTATLQLVDEQMLAGTTDEMRQILRPILAKPLTQSYQALLIPAQAEVNKTWTAQVYQPFMQLLASKYPFNTSAHIEATTAEIGQLFGDQGALGKFVETTLGPLVVRRGNQLEPKTWDGMGVVLNPQFIGDFPRYLAGGGNAAGGGGGAVASTASGAAPAANVTTFQMMPMPTAGLTEYTIEVDGQLLRYRNGVQEWITFLWPNQGAQPGARIKATTFDGTPITLLEVPGAYGVERMMSSAKRKPLGDGVFEMSWAAEGATVSVRFRLVSGGGAAAAAPPSQQPGAAPSAGNGLKGLMLPQLIVGGVAPVAVATDVGATTATANTAVVPPTSGNVPPPSPPVGMVAPLQTIGRVTP